MQNLPHDDQVARVDRAVEQTGGEGGQGVVRCHDTVVVGGADAGIQPGVTVHHVITCAAGDGVVAATAEDDFTAGEGCGQSGCGCVVVDRAVQDGAQPGNASHAIGVELMTHLIRQEQVGPFERVVLLETR